MVSELYLVLNPRNCFRQFINTVERAVYVWYSRLPMDLDWDNIQTTSSTFSSSLLVLLLHHVAKLIVPITFAILLAYEAYSRASTRVPFQTLGRTSLGRPSDFKQAISALASTWMQTQLPGDSGIRFLCLRLGYEWLLQVSKIALSIVAGCSLNGRSRWASC